MSITHEAPHDHANRDDGSIDPRTSAFESLYAMQTDNPEGFLSFVSLLASGAALSQKGKHDLEAEAAARHGDDPAAREAYKKGRALLEFISDQDGLPAHFEHHELHGHLVPGADEADASASDGGASAQPPADEQPAGQP